MATTNSVIGPLRIRWRQDGHQVVMSSSRGMVFLRHIADDTEAIEGVEVPSWVELTTSGGTGPEMSIRVELRDGYPAVTGLSWKSRPDQEQIRQKHLRETDLAKLATDLIASTIHEELVPMVDVSDIEIPEGVISTETMAELRRSQATMRRFVESQRVPRARRVITDDVLKKVAQVYRENIDGTPTKAVGEAFNVGQRGASKYVEKARAKGYLPPTKRGQKKA